MCMLAHGGECVGCARTLQPAEHLAVALHALCVWAQILPHLLALLWAAQAGASSNFVLRGLQQLRQYCMG